MSLSSRISSGKSIKKGIVSEAKAIHASVVIVGITVPGALGYVLEIFTALALNFQLLGSKSQFSLRQGTSAARYCAKHLPLQTEVMAVNNGKVVYRSISSKKISG